MGTRGAKEETFAVSKIVFHWLDGALGLDSSPMAFNALQIRVQRKCPTPSTRVGDGKGGDSGVGRGKKLEQRVTGR